jgi:hypothetical protein
VLNVEGRHPALSEFTHAFDFEHLPEGKPKTVSRTFHDHALHLLELLPDGPGLTRALHRLWESKNEAVFLAVRVQLDSGTRP